MSSKSKKQVAQVAKNTATITKVSEIDLTKTLAATSGLGLQIQAALGKIQEDLINKHSELQSITDAISLKKKEMADLHESDQILLSLDELRVKHETEIEELEISHANRLAELQEIRNRAATEDVELQQHREVLRQRESADYSYNLQLSRKKDNDVWAEQLRLRASQERDKQEKFDKDIANREAAIKTQEEEYKAALSKAASFDKELEAAVGTKVGIITNNTKREHEHQIQLFTIKHDAALNALTHDNKRLVESANSLEIQIKELQSALKEAYASNAALAAKAVDGASDKAAQASAMATLTNIGGPRNGQATSRG